MLIDKLLEEWTEKEKETAAGLLQILESDDSAVDDSIADKARRELWKMHDDIKQRYISKRQPGGLLDDIRETVTAIEQSDFLKYIERSRRNIESIIDLCKKNNFTIGTDTEKHLEKQLSEYIENYDNCFKFISERVAVQLKGLEEHAEEQKAAVDIINSQVSLWYMTVYKPTHIDIDRIKMPVGDAERLAWEALQGKIKDKEGKPQYHNALDINKGKAGYVELAITFEDKQNANITASRPLNNKDKLIHLCVANMYMKGKDEFTITELYQFMNGTTNNPSKTDADDLVEILEKLCTTRVTVDNTAYVETAKKGSVIQKTEYLLEAVSYKRIVGGTNRHTNRQNTATVYKVKEMPILLRLAIASGKKNSELLTSVPIKTLNIPGVNNTEAQLAKVFYIITRIQQMKYNEKRNRADSNKINYATFYENCDIKNDNKSKSRAQKALKKILDHYKDIGYITDYEEVKGVNRKNKPVNPGIKITL